MFWKNVMRPLTITIRAVRLLDVNLCTAFSCNLPRLGGRGWYLFRTAGLLLAKPRLNDHASARLAGAVLWS